MEKMELYIHIPFCMKKCLYCDFLSGVYSNELQHAYAVALCNEMRYYSSLYKEKEISTVFIGGGTPSWLDEKDMAMILDAIKENFNISKDVEWTIECNPGTVTEEKLISYRNHGVNRLSIGLQSANDDELRTLGRVHTFSQFLKTFELARSVGFNNINVDLMTGLPNQDISKLKNTLRKVIMLRPEHISCYALIIEEGTPFFDLYEKDEKRRARGEATSFLPDEELEMDLYNLARNELLKAGYESYEISNFAKKGFECRHNIGYWKRTPYLGIGIGAASLIEEKGKVNSWIRWNNERDIYKYIEYYSTYLVDKALICEKTELSTKDAMEEFMYLGLRMTKGVFAKDFFDSFGCDIESVYGGKINELKEKDLLIMEEGRIKLSQLGQNISNVVLAEFLLD